MTKPTVLSDKNNPFVLEYLAPHGILPQFAAAVDLPVIANAAHPDALFIRSGSRINAQTLRYAPRFIGTATLGTDHIDAHFIAELNVQHGTAFASAVGASRHSVAQYVVAALLTARADLVQTTISAARQKRAKDWVANSWAIKPPTLGIIGLGHIGSTLAYYGRQLGFAILGHDPFLPKSALNNASLEQLLQKSDVVSLHTPLTDAGVHPTRHLIGAKELALLKNDALLINTARGGVIDEAALLALLNNNPSLAVVLDVFDNEPIPNAELIARATFATPHIAGHTIDGKLATVDAVYRAFCAKFALPILRTAADFLPKSPLRFADLCADLTQIAAFYDIKQDSMQLKNAPNEFARLRAEYGARRAWQP